MTIKNLTVVIIATINIIKAKNKYIFSLILLKRYVIAAQAEAETEITVSPESSPICPLPPIRKHFLKRA
jgi:uncharacterized membrane protein